MPNIGGPELIIVLAVFVLLFGAKKLPELGSSVGKSIQNFKRGMAEAKDEAKDDEVQAEHDGDTEHEDSSVGNAPK